MTENWEVPQLPMFYMGPGRRVGGRDIERERARDSASNKLYISTKRKRHDRVHIQRTSRGRGGPKLSASMRTESGRDAKRAVSQNLTLLRQWLHIQVVCNRGWRLETQSG